MIAIVCSCATVNRSSMLDDLIGLDGYLGHFLPMNTLGLDLGE